MQLDTLKNTLPDYAKDIKLNLSNVMTPGNLNATQIYVSAIASAHSKGHSPLVDALTADAREAGVDDTHIEAAKTANALMAMNNIYYRFVHLTSDKEYMQMPAGLRMNGIKSHGIESVDFELASLAVSAINGCGMCMDAHANQLIKAGATKQMVQDAVRLGAVVNAVADILVAEAA